MKKFGIVLAVAAVMMLLAATSAFALEAPYTHGDFATNSKGCADCHVTHAASAQKLLNGGNGTQTSFCLTCHGTAATGSPFDVDNGKMMANSGWTPDPRNVTGNWNDGSVMHYSYAGGFRQAYDFGDTNALKDPSSIHNVRGADANFNLGGGLSTDITTYQYDEGDVIPGSDNLDIDFECGSCHNPHAGGSYDDNQADKNPRLLKEVLPADGTTRRVMMTFNQDLNTVNQYTYGFNQWCGGCHDVFNTAKAGDIVRTGYNDTGRHAYMHKFGIVVNDAQFGGAGNPYTVGFLALERDPNNGGQKQIACITCHRAHGSSADAAPMNWNRYDQYKGYQGAAQNITNAISASTGSGSALLRMKERDVCFKCHGAAQYNHDVTH